ncbi:hypothetical protein NCG89_15440 [Spongiibacter taiwanensis]|uniref:hypothetical protein n=1 Tax=Spongiibacter taiwanensis TaxID=1748242 RepID=UPI002035287A|nr:hypothetical protein [Spongiibacter taiwanensis]USA42918.1 hypothetical protein NCG89_15440 [Spongiibacter taiwanensis]
MEQHEPLYDLYLTGGLVAGQNSDSATEGLARLFKQPLAKVRPLLCGKAYCVKRGLTLAQSQRYQQALTGIGVETRLLPASAQPAAPSSKPEPLTKPEPPTKTDTTDSGSSAGLHLTPPGTPVLSDKEREKPPIPEVDTGNMLLAAPGEPLNPMDAPPPAIQPDVDHLTLAAVGSTIGQPTQATVPPHLIDPGKGVTLADPGASLTTTERPAPPPSPDTSHLNLAP